MIRPMTLLVRTFVFPITVLVATSGLADSWPAFRGPNGTGAVHDAALPPGDGPLSLETAWKRPLGSGYSGISVGGGKLVTGYQDGKSDYLVALDPDTGEEVWRYELSPAYMGIDGSHDGPISTPAIADGRVFMLGRNGRLAAIELSSGEEIWSTHLAEDLGSETPYYGFGSFSALLEG